MSTSAESSDNPDDWDDHDGEFEDEEFEDEEFEELLHGFIIEAQGSEQPTPDVVDRLHAVVKEVTGYHPPSKSTRLPTIGFIQ